MDEMLKKQDVLDALMDKIRELEKKDAKADVVLGLAAAMSTVKQMQAVPVNPAEKQEPCKDTISREAVIDIIEDVCPIYGNDYRYILRDKVNELPPVTPAEKVGQWIARGLVDSNGNRIYECSECHHFDTQAATMIVPYCWYCGVKMEGEG